MAQPGAGNDQVLRGCPGSAPWPLAPGFALDRIGIVAGAQGEVRKGVAPGDCGRTFTA